MTPSKRPGPAAPASGPLPSSTGRGTPASAPALHPHAGPRPTTSNAERAVYRALLRGLPPGWTAWHSLRLRSGGTWEGEGDFVIAIPERAIVVLEVKGGAIEVRDGQWYQNGQPLKQAPRDQAHRFRRILEAELRKTGRYYPPILVATMFPDTAFAAPPSHGDLRDAVLGQQDLPWIGRALEELVERALGDAPRMRETEWVSTLHRLWGETWVPTLSTGARIELRARELVPLDQEQLVLLDMLAHSTRLLVRGGPGTGKTLLAEALCARRPPALYLCWTRALAAAVRAAGHDAWTVREYAKKLLDDAGVTVADGAPAETWSTEIWENVALHAAVDAVPAARPHAIVVVDEAQDFSDADWDLVKALGQDRALWAFGDAGQSFWAERRIPEAPLFPAVFELRRQYRCPEGVTELAERYRGSAAGAGPVAPENELRVVVTGQGETVQDRVRIEVARALRGGAKPGAVAVLSLLGQTKSALLRETRLGDVRVVRADAADADEHVVVDTFLRFKGLERPIVFVTELETAAKYDVRMHIALTRATLQAIVIATPEQVRADPRLARAPAAPPLSPPASKNIC